MTKTAIHIPNPKQHHPPARGGEGRAEAAPDSTSAPARAASLSLRVWDSTGSGAVRECACCGELFSPVRGVQVWCSPRCSAVGRKRRWRAANVDACRDRERARDRRGRAYPSRVRSCLTCASPLPVDGRRDQRCDECLRPLPVLGSLVVSGGRCSELSSAPRSRRFFAGLCRECGDAFVATSPHAIYCSVGCGRRNEKRRHRAKRRHRMRGGESVDLAVVADRDGWVCHLCGTEVDRSTWSLDHLVPLALGGGHSYSNVALAHHLCNSRRGAKRLDVSGPAA